MSTGFRFNYWSHNGASDGAANKYDGKARAKHSSLKAEMLSTPNFDADEWEYLMDEARRLHRSERGKALKVTESDHQASYYDLKKGQQISEFHFQCLLAYTNYDDNCYEFRKTLRRNKPSESIESVMSRNSAYFFMSKGLAELVQMFGTNGYDERGPFFTGLSQQFVMRSFYVKFAGATSTSKQLAVALRFAGPAGVLLTLENDTTMSGSSRCFDCSWCSQYAEDERLFMASRRELRLESVILVEAATDFSKYFAALFKFDAMLSGGRIWPLTTSLRDVQIIDKLCMDQLTPSDLAPSNIPEYISQCFSLWCQRKEEVEINIYNLEQFQGLSRMIMDKVVGVDNDGTVKGSDTLEGANILKPRVFGMFGNLKKVDIWTRESGANKKQYPISMDKFLSFICGLDTGVEYMIVANSDFGGTVATWLYQEVNEKTEQMFKEKGWEIEKHLDGLTQWLKLKNVQ